MITTTYINDASELYDWNITEYAQAHLGQEISLAFDIAPSNNVQHTFGSIEENLNPGQLSLVAGSVIATWDGTMWSPRVPMPGDTVIIADDYDTATEGSLDVNTIEIQTGMTLTVADNTFIQTQGDITVNGTLELANAGSIIQVDPIATTTNNGSVLGIKFSGMILNTRLLPPRTPPLVSAVSGLDKTIKSLASRLGVVLFTLIVPLLMVVAIGST